LGNGFAVFAPFGALPSLLLRVVHLIAIFRNCTPFHHAPYLWVAPGGFFAFLVCVIASVTIRNFRALRNASLSLLPFNLVIGPNGSGKTSLILALQRLRSLARLPLRDPPHRKVDGHIADASPAGLAARATCSPHKGADGRIADGCIADGPEISWHFTPPFDGVMAVMRCVSETECDFLDVVPLSSGAGRGDWPRLCVALAGIRCYVLDHRALASRSLSREGAELKGDGANLATVLAALQLHAPGAFDELREALCRILPEYDDLQWAFANDGTVELQLRLADSGGLVAAEHLSQGTLYLLGLLALAYDPTPPPVVCIEEIDRGFHPRLLRDVRDVLYRLSYPEASGLKRAPVQVIATTHSPFMLDLFSEHPEEVVLAEKHGEAAQFSRLSDRKDLTDVLDGGGLGDMWYAGILGGVPQESATQESATPFETDATDQTDATDESGEADKLP
jgi:energy-coupling factor transporter ATP-binding protein EcfA2